MRADGAVLVCPPLTTACEPDPSVVALSGHLIARGIPSKVVDANLRYQQALFALPLPQSPLPPLTPLLAEESAAAAIDNRTRLGWRRGALAFKALSNPKTYEKTVPYRAAIANLYQGFRALGKVYGGRFTPSDFTHPDLSGLCSEDLAEAANDPARLPGVGAGALKLAVEEILSASPRVVAVSASYLSQALFAHAIAGLLREAGFDGLLLLGGGLIGSWTGKIEAASPLFGVWDALVTGPGEEVVQEAALSGKVPDLPGVLAPKAGIWRAATTWRDATVCFAPDAQTPPWGQYLAPGGIIPVTASRGCYWGRCAFCPEATEEGKPRNYVPSSASELARTLIGVRDAHGVSNVHFTDNAVSPSHLRKIAGELKGQQINWYGFARLEQTMAKPGFMDELAAGGCAMLQLGIESATPRLNRLMHKGIDIELADRVVRAASDAGIRIYGYFLFGTPTETEAEARATLEWIRERADHFTCLNMSLMNLPREGLLAKAPEDFGLEKLTPLDHENDLALYLGHSGKGTVDRRTLRRMLREARKDPVLKPLLNRSPKGMKSKHAAFMPL
jgi:hypothetical protein